MEKQCKIYLPEAWMYNDATAFYVEIIADAMRKKGYVVSTIKSKEEITKSDIVVTIMTYSVRTIIKRHPHKIINWVQGIAPEEYLFFLRKKEDGLFHVLKKYLKLSFYDYYALKHCNLQFFVSETMLSFYRKKLLYKGKNNFIMPCFNQNLQPSAFFDEKYQTPSFVYAGSMDGWQCFDETVATFVKIKKKLPHATFTVLTAAKEVASSVLQRYGVEAEIKYVSHDKVDEELRKYKYGFIIREDNVVNRVATPTKLNSYMANGIIPVYSDVIGAFKGRISNLKYTVPLGKNGSGLSALFDLEKQNILANDVLSDYKALFDSYYSREKYIEEIASLSF